MKYRFEKTVYDDRRIVIDETGAMIGIIYRSYSRLGGAGWTSKAGSWTYPSMKDAAEALQRSREGMKR